MEVYSIRNLEVITHDAGKVDNGSNWHFLLFHFHCKDFVHVESSFQIDVHDIIKHFRRQLGNVGILGDACSIHHNVSCLVIDGLDL